MDASIDMPSVEILFAVPSNLMNKRADAIYHGDRGFD